MPVKKLDWTEDGYCENIGNRIFFSTEPGIRKIAQDICKECPVKEPCLEYAMDRNERFGIWGGLTPRARLKLRRQRLRDAQCEAS